MKIINQENFNECGICCLNMLVNYYTNNDLNIKNEILQKCNLTRLGLNLLELEQLCYKYKIILDSYQANWNEIANIKTNNPLIFVLNYEGIFHYVIGFVKNKQIHIYDPNKDKKYIVKNQEEFSNWTGYVCFTKYTKFKITNIDLFLPLFKNFNLLITLMFILINLLEFTFSIFVSWFISKMINLTDINSDINNVWKLSFVYITLVCLNIGFNFLNDYLKSIYFLKNYRKITLDFFNLINHKNYYFYECYNKQQIFQIWNLNNHLLSFYCNYWSDFIVQVLLLLSSIFLILLINHLVISILLFMLVFKIILNIFILKIDKKVQKNIIVDQINIEYKFNNLLDFKNYNHHYQKENNLSFELINCLENTTNNKIHSDHKSSLIHCLVEFVSMLLNFVLIIFLYKININIGVLFLLFNLFNSFNNANSNLINTVKGYFQIKPIYQYLLKVYCTNNVEFKDGLKLISPKVIKWNNLVYTNNLCINCDNLSSHQLIKMLLKYDDINEEIQINNIKFNNYDKQYLHQKIIYVDQNYMLSKKETLKIIEVLNISNFEVLDIDWDNFNFLKINIDFRIILILMSLIKTKDSIICFNNLFNYCLYESFSDLINNLVKKINENNFIIANNVNEKFVTSYDNFI